MAYSSLKRKTPLKRVGFKRRTSEEKPSERSEGRKAVRNSSKSSLETHLDIVFSLYIRLRDAMDGGRTQCVSCGRVYPFEMMQCGHYFTRHNMATRWDEDNCWSQCVECNCHRHGNLDGYTPRLLARIGRERFDALGERARGMRKWGGDELREMIRRYASEARRLAKDKGINVKI